MSRISHIQGHYGPHPRRKRDDIYMDYTRKPAWWRHGFYEARNIERDFLRGKYPNMPHYYNKYGGLNMDFFHKYTPEEDLL